MCRKGVETAQQLFIDYEFDKEIWGKIEKLVDRSSLWSWESMEGCFRIFFQVQDLKYIQSLSLIIS